MKVYSCDICGIELGKHQKIEGVVMIDGRMQIVRYSIERLFPGRQPCARGDHPSGDLCLTCLLDEMKKVVDQNDPKEEV